MEVQGHKEGRGTSDGRKKGNMTGRYGAILWAWSFMDGNTMLIPGGNINSITGWIVSGVCGKGELV